MSSNRTRPVPRWPVLDAVQALPPVPEAASRARWFVRDATADWAVPKPVVDDAVAVVAEIMANVVLHAVTPVVLTVSFDGRTLLITSTDGAPEGVEVRVPADTDETGRGLLMIDTLASEWGVEHTPVGKLVWAALAAGDRVSG